MLRSSWLPATLCALLFAACGLSVTRTQTPPTTATPAIGTAAAATPTASPAETPIPQPSATPSATPTPAVSCPPAPTSALEMVHIGVATAAACYGQTSLTIEGFSLDCGGCGGVDTYDRSPPWLAVLIPEFYVGPLPGTAGLDPSMGFPVFIDPATGISFPAPGARVRVTGHFNDPAALTCTMTPVPGSGASALDPNSVITSCKQAFVVTAVSEVTP